MRKIIVAFLCCTSFFLIACTDYSPKPYGYFRIELGEHAYKYYTDSTYFSFQMPSDAVIVTVDDEVKGEWFDIAYPSLNAKIHCSYLPITPSQFADAAEDGRKFVYRHVLKADAISEQVYSKPEQRMYGIIYDIGGNVASPVQFVLTDSVSHFFRGSLYFDCVPNQDSISPVLEHVREDILEMIATFQWKN